MLSHRSQRTRFHVYFYYSIRTLPRGKCTGASCKVTAILLPFQQTDDSHACGIHRMLTQANKTFPIGPFSSFSVSNVSKQELYFVKQNYEIFSTEVSAREKQEQNKGGPHQGVIGSLVISSVGRPF